MPLFTKKTNVQAPILNAVDIETFPPHEIQTRHGVDYLSLENRTNFSISGGRTVGLADSEYGWTWVNRANLNSGDENITTSNAFTMSLALGGIYNWGGGGTNAPARTKQYTPSDKIQYWYSFLGADSTANVDTELISLLLYEKGDTSKFARIGVGHANASDNMLSYNINGVGGSVAITASQKAGMWVRIARSKTELWVSYNTSTDPSSVPTTWTLALSDSSALSDADIACEVGHVIQNGTGAGAVTGTIKKFIDEDAFAVSENLQAQTWSATQFDSSNTEIQLMDDWDLGDNGVTLNEESIQNIMTDAVNKLHGNSATWTFSIKQATDTNATSGTFRSAGSIEVEGTGRYVSMWAKCNASTGEESGSLRVPINLAITSK